jgi:hypothetical protein
VDVTGTWQSTESGFIEFALKQQEAKVTGSMRVVRAAIVWPWTNMSEPIDGTVAGDPFRFRVVNGNANGEMTVSEEEMSGWLRASPRFTGRSERSVVLRRTLPSPQQR